MTSQKPIRTWQDAEYNAAARMREWGYQDATVSPGGADGGVDVTATGVVGQVKFEAAHVGRPVLQRLVGARGRKHDLALFMFTGAGYSSAAVAYADSMDIALFIYNLDGQITAVNETARRVMRSVGNNDRPGRDVIIGATICAGSVGVLADGGWSWQDPASATWTILVLMFAAMAGIGSLMRLPKWWHRRNQSVRATERP